MDLATLSRAAHTTPRWAALLLSLLATAACADAGAAGTIRSGTLVFTVAEGEPVDIPRVRSDVKVDVSGIAARIEIRQRFRNPYDQAAEGIYAFPLPAQAGIERLSVVQDGRLVSDARRKIQPQQLYDRARGGMSQLSTAQQRPTLFRAPVTDIRPRATLDITIGYVQMLDHGLDRQRLRVPLAANHGPLPDLSIEAASLAPAVDGGWVQMVDRPARSVAGGTQAVSVRVDIDAGVAITGIISRNHRIEVQAGARATITSNSERAPAGHDFELEWVPDARQLPRMPLARTSAEQPHLLRIANRDGR